MSRRDDEFYVGYLPQAPSGTARFVRNVVVMLLVVAVGVAVLLVSRQQRFSDGLFEFGIDRSFEGMLIEQPYPMLVTAEQSYLLTEFGKFGSAERVAGRNGEMVSIEGSLIERDGRAMIEVHAMEPLDGSLAIEPSSAISQGRVTLEGEIVDSKCFLGVMKPGHTKPHRGCAVRCISGGIPPMLLVVEPQWAVRKILIAAEDGSSINRHVLPYVAEPVALEGELLRRGDLEILLVDPAEIRRLS